MTGPIKPLAPGAEQFTSINKYKKYCEHQLENKLAAEGKEKAAVLDLSQVQVLDRDAKDGNYEILYRDAENNFFCGAHLSLQSHEMVVRAGISDQKTLQGEGHLAMDDACSVSRHVLGSKGKRSTSCQDGMVSPELLKPTVQQSPSIQFFADHCHYHLVQKMKGESGYLPPLPFALERTQVLNSDPIEPTYQLRYESLGQDFVCEATIDPQSHGMTIFTGAYQEEFGKGKTVHVEMTDTCTLTQELVGKSKINSNCKDKTLEERSWEQRAELLFAGYVNYLGGKWMWGKVAKRIPKMKVLPGAMWNTAGNALMAGWVFDQATGLFLSPDNPIRKYGYYGALTAGAFAPVLWKKMASTQIVKAAGSRLAAHSLLSKAVGKVPWSKLGGRLLAVMAFNYGFKWAMGLGDYDSWVNDRVTDIVYDEDVYDLDGWDLLVVPLLVKGVRAGCRELAPDAMNWAVTKDNSGVKQKILKEDADASREIRKYLGESLPVLLSLPGQYDPTDPKSFQEFDLSELEEPIEHSLYELSVAKTLATSDPKMVQRVLNLSEEKYFHLLRRYHLSQIQKGAQFLVAVDQPLNDWARRIFKPDGTLRKGKAEELLYMLGDPDTYSDPSSSELLRTRKLQVLLANLDGQKQFAGSSLEQVNRAAGVVDSEGKLKLNGAYITALTLYASEVRASQDPGQMKRLEELTEQLKWRYLDGNLFARNGAGDALRVLGIDPHQVIRPTASSLPEIPMCLKEDPKGKKMERIIKKFAKPYGP